MAGESETEGAPDAGSSGLPCPPCRGTGTVLAAQEGQARPVACPWCEGSGRRRPIPGT